MNTATKSNNIITMTVDTMVKRDPRMEHLREIEKVLTSTESDLEKVKSSGDFTPQGLKDRAERRFETTKEDLKKHEETIAKLEAAVEATKRKALEQVQVQSDPTIEREIRDRLMAAKEDPIVVGLQYIRAIENGDHSFARAVETAPPSFPLIDENARQRGEAMKLSRSPAKEQIDIEENAAATYKQIVTMTRRELAKLAQSYGVQF